MPTQWKRLLWRSAMAGGAEEEEEPWTRVAWAVLKEYMTNTSLHGYRYLTEPGRHVVERLVWLLVHALAVWGVLLVITDVWHEFLSTPTVTTVDSTTFPIWQVPFPAVAVCNLNKISFRAAENLAKDMSARTGEPEKELLPLVRMLGHLYDYDVDQREMFMPLHRTLQRAYGDNYNVTHIMLLLTPRCEELLVRCMWAGRPRPCAELFTQRKTMDGFCCAFNYLRFFDDFVSDNVKYDWSKHNTAGVRTDLPGAHLGLSVVVNPQPDDYYYPLISSYGSKVLVFNPHDFPDTPSGGLVEKLVPLRAEVFFRLEASSVFSTEGVRGFAVSRRRCLFTSELRGLFAGYYSYSECLMNCRILSITRLCRCVPYYFPSRGTTRECHLIDIECLARYREKWWTLRPSRAVEGLEAEIEESIACDECLPACSDTSYHVQTTSAPLAHGRFSRSTLLENVSLMNHSVFHLFFGSYGSTRLKQDVLYYWYELLSNFGGICGLFVGFSLVSIIELFYFLTLRLGLALRDSRRRRARRRGAPGGRPTLPPALGLAAKADLNRSDIYWREILPRY